MPVGAQASPTLAPELNRRQIRAGTALRLKPDRVEFTSTQLAEARQLLDRRYGLQLLSRHGGDSRYAISISVTDASLFTSSELRLPGDVVCDVRAGKQLQVNTVIDGCVEARRGRDVDRYQRGDVYLARLPDAGYRCHSSELHVQAIALPFAALDGVVREISGRRRPLRFLSMTPAHGGVGRWQATARFVTSLLAAPGATPQPLVLDAAVRLLAVTVLSVFPNDLLTDPARRRESGDAHPETLKRSIAFIEANSELDIGIADIARAAHVTPRAVQLAFRRHLDTTPMNYLRLIRLRGAHEQLRSAEREQRLTVSDVALRWGFANPSRFAQYYRTTFGQTPSRTLRG